MDNTLKNILDADKHARTQKKQAEAYRDGVFLSIKNDIAELEAAQSDYTKKKLEDVEDAFRKGEQKRISDIKTLYAQKIEKIERIAAEKTDEWVDALYRRIIEGAPTDEKEGDAL